jgi:hypothetical protein
MCRKGCPDTEPVIAGHLCSCSPRGFDLGTRRLPSQIAHHDGTDANRLVLGERFHENLLPSPDACPMNAILDEVPRVEGLPLWSLPRPAP